MSLQVSLLSYSHPSLLLNALALLFVLVGGVLLLATRWCEQLAVARLASEESAPAESSARPLRFFYRFGFICLALALAISWGSRLL